MASDRTLRRARQRSGLSLRALAARAGTSHSTLAAYEAGRIEPGVATMARIVRAAGFDMVSELRPRLSGPGGSSRGDELVDVLHLAAQFPARHSPTLEMPPFGATRHVVPDPT